MFTPRPLLRSLPRGLRLTPPHPTPASIRSDLAAHKRRQTTLIVCAALSMSALWFLATSIDIDLAHKTESPPGTTPAIKPGTPVILHSAAEKAAGVELVPSGTTSVPAFPKTLRLGGTEYALVGLGIRTVSFLGIEVYVVGVYVAAGDLATVQAALARRVGEGVTAATEGGRDVLRGELAVEGEAFWQGLLVGAEGAPGVRSVLRIVPTRNTDYQHLRDGWIRGIQSRTSKNAAYDDEAFSHALTSFKQAFGQKKSVPKQKTLLLVRDAHGGLECLFDPTGRNDGRVGGDADKDAVVVLGSVADGRLSTALWMCYVGAGKVASEPARKSVVEGLLALVERPVGTVGGGMA
ncbi:hypothetical protein P167DRAFT_518541 [Morchella conica CCBAS932]|uniref:Chalcone isomerase domain-containing protein n=1 Tax=Morchella conica CCBAS932 TaxID=1392247 RepID=A0A3N4KXT4_9PEZI|nr:hypothetical protein P167DRAFT_518541 [Morchella conica CCBAS932]